MCQIREVSLYQGQHTALDQGQTFLSCANASGDLVSRPVANNCTYADSFLLQNESGIVTFDL